MDRAAVLAEFGSQMRRDPAAEPGSLVEREPRVTRIISRGDGWSGVLWSDLTEADADAVIGAQVSRFAELARTTPFTYPGYQALGGLAPRTWARCVPVKSQNGHSETRRTVIIAGMANLVVGLAKLAAGIISGSSAMLAEAAHSAADTLNQVFLLTSLRQADRPADDAHPFGHGQERYFWSLLAAFGIFIAGAGFSVFEGLLSLTRSQSESPLAAYVTLAVAFVAEGISFARAFWQVRGEAHGSHEEVLDHVESSPDITVKVNLFEDSAAVVGLVLAALGVGLDQLTGSHIWDGAASIAIGVLLVVVAVKLGMDSRELLIGRAADPEVQKLIRDEIESRPGVDALLELRTMHMGPDNIIVAARVALNDEMGADQAEDLADEIDRRLSEKLPLQPNVFIDPTQTRRTPPAEAAGSADAEAAGSADAEAGGSADAEAGGSADPDAARA